MPKDILREEAKDTTIAYPCLETDQDKENEEIKSSPKTEGKKEVLHSVDGLKENSDNPLVREETGSENVESKGVKLSNDSSTKQNEKEIDILSIYEDQELHTSKKDQVTSSQDTASVEELQAKNYDSEGKESHFVTTRESKEEVAVEIKSSNEMKENVEQEGLLHNITTNASISTPTESQVETTKHEEKIEREVIESDNGQKESSRSPLIKEVCEETGPDKDEYEEEVKHYDSSDVKLDEKVIEILSKHEDQESKHEVNLSEKNQGEGNELEVVKTKGSIEEDADEIKSSVDATENMEQQRVIRSIPTNFCISTQKEPKEEIAEKEEKNDQETIGSDDCQTKKYGILVVKEAYEKTVPEKTVESKKGLEIYDNSSMALNENEIASKDADQEKEQELYVSEQGQTGEDDVTSSQNASNEDIKEMACQHATPMAYFEETQDLNAVPKDILKEEAKNTISDLQEERCEDGADVKSEQKTEEHDNKNAHSCLVTDPEKETEEIKPSVETEEKREQQGLLHAITTDACITTQTEKETTSQDGTIVAYLEEARGLNEMPKDILKDEAKDTAIDPQEAREQHENGMNDKREQKPEEIVHSCLEIEQEKYAEEIKPSVETEGEREQQELMHDIITDACILAQTEYPVESHLDTTKHVEKNDGEEETIESHDGPTDKSHNVLVKEVCEEIGLEKAESEERVKLLEGSNIKPNEKAIATLSKDEYHENEQELYMPEENQGEVEVTCSQNAASKDDLQGKNYDGEHNESEFDETRRTTKEDIDVTRTNVQKDKRKVQQELLDAMPTDIYMSAQTESQEWITENDESIGGEDGPKEKLAVTKEVCEETDPQKAKSEEEIKNSDSSSMKLNEKTIATFKDEDQEKDKEVSMSTGSQDDVKEVCEETVSKKEEQFKEGLKLSESSSMALDEDEIESKCEDHKNKQELYVSEKGQIGGDDVTSSQNASSEDIKETTSQDAIIVAYLGKARGLNEMPKDILKDEAKDTTIDLHKIEYPEPIPVENTEVTKVEAASQIEQENTNDTCGTVMGGLSSEKFLDQLEEIDAKEDIEVIVTEEEKAIEESKQQNAVAEVIAVEHLSQTDEILLNVEKAKESISIKDNINQKATCTHNQLTSATDKACQNKSLNSSPNELLETKGSAEDTEDPKLVAENLNLKAETLTVMEEPNEDVKQNVGMSREILASEYERLENMGTGEKIIEADANKEKETLDETHADEHAKTTSDSISSPTEQDTEITSEIAEIFPKGGELSAVVKENLPQASPKRILEKHNPEITTTNEKIKEEFIDKDETHVNMHLSTSIEDVPCLSNEKTGKLQVSTLSNEIDEGKQNDAGDVLNEEREAVQPQEHFSNIEFVDHHSDVEMKKQGELMHCGSQEPSEDNTLPSQNDKIEDSLIPLSLENEMIQGVNERFEEAPEIDVQKSEKDHSGEQEYSGKRTFQDLEAVKEPFQTDKEPSELHAPVTPSTAATEDLEISQKQAIQPETQKYNASDSTVDMQSPKGTLQNESNILTGKIDALHDQSQPAAKSDAEDLNATKASGTEPQCSSVVFKEEKKMSDEKDKCKTAEPAKILFADILHESTERNSEMAANLAEERETTPTKDQQIDKEETGDSGVKTDDENEGEDDDEDNQTMGSSSDTPVMVEASKDMEVKVHKKSHNILSGVGSKVKHSIAKVKKAITGKSSHPKPPSPKEKDQEISKHDVSV